MRTTSTPNDSDPRLLLEAARARVGARLEELRTSLAEIVAAAESANLDDEHDPEGATVGFERAQVQALLDAAHSRLAELDAATDRLRAGTYGTCASCGQPVARARLAARPETRLCVQCASRDGPAGG